MRTALALTACCCCLTLAGCAVNSSSSTCHPNAVPVSLSVGPATGQSATPDHSAAPPGNQVQFTAIVAPDPGPGCPVPQWLLKANAAWTVSDSKEVQISSAADDTNGLATCLAATDGPATVTGVVTYSGFTLTNTSTITCN